jgi:hypothetical protein
MMDMQFAKAVSTTKDASVGSGIWKAKPGLERLECEVHGIGWGERQRDMAVPDRYLAFRRPLALFGDRRQIECRC